MRLLLLKEFFRAGVLVEAYVEQGSSPAGSWNLVLTKQDGETVRVTTAARPDQAKAYVRLNAALMDAHRVGFRSVSVRLPEEFEREDAARTGLK